MKHTAQILSIWLDDRRNRFGEFKEDDTRDLIFQRSFVNLCKAAVLELQSHYVTQPNKKLERGKKSWASGFLKELETYFDAGHQAIDLLNIEYNKEMTSLGKERKAKSYDIGETYPPLRRIEDGPTLSTIGREIEKQFFLGDRADTNYLLGLSESLIQSRIGRNPLSDLKDL